MAISGTSYDFYSIFIHLQIQVIVSRMGQSHESQTVDLIRRRPSMYLPDRRRQEVLAQTLAEDALALGAKHIQIIRLPDHWWTVAADRDWLESSHEQNLAIKDYFFRLVPFTDKGVNAIRGEVLCTAFASAVVTCTATERLVVTGHHLVSETLWTRFLVAGMTRSIAFRWKPEQ